MEPSTGPSLTRSGRPVAASQSETSSPAAITDAVVADLRGQGARMTVSRRLVIEALAGATTHLSAEDILDRVKAQAPDVHLATVYRNLEALLAAGVATHVHLPHGATTYHLIRADHPHHIHVVCRACDTVLDIPGDALDDVATRLDDSLGFLLDSHHVALTGHCASCRTGSATASDEADV